MSMKTFILNSFIFAAGATIGSAVTYKLLKTKFEEIANEEIRSVREMYRQKAEDDAEDRLVGDLDIHSEIMVDRAEKRPLSEYAKILKDTGYTENIEEDDENMEEPYVIPPEEFGELEGYSTVTLYCHNDGVITDEQDDVVENAERILGEDIMSHFGEYEDDSIFIRNDIRRCDYEILRVADDYMED